VTRAVEPATKKVTSIWAETVSRHNEVMTPVRTKMSSTWPH